MQFNWYSAVKNPKEPVLADLGKVKMEIRELEVISQQIADERLENDIAKLSQRCSSLCREVNETIRNCTVKLGSLRNSSIFVNEQLAWLQETQIAITAPHSLPLHVHEVQKLLTKLNQLENESKIKIEELEAILANPDEKMSKAERDQARSDLLAVKERLLEDFKVQKELMHQALSARKTYAARLNSVSGQLGSAAARLDLIESDCHGFKMPDQEELKFTDREIDEVRSTLLDKFSEFEEASQCLSMSTLTNHAGQGLIRSAGWSSSSV